MLSHEEICYTKRAQTERERERDSQKNMAQATNIAQHHHRTAKQQEQHLAISSAHCTHIWTELLPVWLRTHRTIRKLDYYQCPPSAKYKVFFSLPFHLSNVHRRSSQVLLSCDHI